MGRGASAAAWTAAVRSSGRQCGARPARTHLARGTDGKSAAHRPSACPPTPMCWARPTHHTRGETRSLQAQSRRMQTRPGTRMAHRERRRSSMKPVANDHGPVRARWVRGGACPSLVGYMCAQWIKRQIRGRPLRASGVVTSTVCAQWPSLSDAWAIAAWSHRQPRRLRWAIAWRRRLHLCTLASADTAVHPEPEQRHTCLRP